MAKKISLEIFCRPEITIFAISAPMKDYKFIWNLDTSYDMEFYKRDPYIHQINKTPVEFNVFTDDEIKNVIIISNKSESIPLQKIKGIDLFLISKTKLDEKTTKYWYDLLKSMPATTFVKEIEDEKIISNFQTILEEMEYQEMDRNNEKKFNENQQDVF